MHCIYIIKMTALADNPRIMHESYHLPGDSERLMPAVFVHDAAALLDTCMENGHLDMADTYAKALQHKAEKCIATCRWYVSLMSRTNVGCFIADCLHLQVAAADIAAVVTQTLPVLTDCTVELFTLLASHYSDEALINDINVLCGQPYEAEHFTLLCTALQLRPSLAHVPNITQLSVYSVYIRAVRLGYTANVTTEGPYEGKYDTYSVLFPVKMDAIAGDKHTVVGVRDPKVGAYIIDPNYCYILRPGRSYVRSWPVSIRVEITGGKVIIATLVT